MPIKNSDAFGAVEAVRRQGKQPGPKLLHIDGQPPATARGVDEERKAALGRDLAQFTNRFDDPDVMVDVVNANQNGLRGDGGADRLRIDLPFGIYFNPGAGE